MLSFGEPRNRIEIIQSYKSQIQLMRSMAPGSLRAAKGKLVEGLAEDIIRLAWHELKGHGHCLSFGEKRTYQIPIQSDYVDTLHPEVRDFIQSHIGDYYYSAHVDKHVFVNGKFVVGVECKSYTENAMLKRILVDFELLKSLHSELVCCLLQLESQLGGNYSNPLEKPQLGSPSTHTLLSHFPSVELNIVTLLEGPRTVNEEISRPEYYKPLREEILNHAIEQFSELMQPFLNL